MLQKLKKDEIVFISFVFVGFIALFFSGTVIYPFVLGVIGAYIFSSSVRFLEKFFIPRALSSFAIIFVAIAIIVFLISIIFPFIKNEIINVSRNIPNLVAHVQKKIEPLWNYLEPNLSKQELENLRSQLGNQLGSISQWFSSAMLQVLSGGLIVANVLTIMFLTPIIMFYTLKDWPAFTRTLEDNLPERYKKTLLRFSAAVHKNLSSFFVGQSLVCLCLAIMYAIGLSIIGLKGAVIVGIFIGVLSFIPYVGAICGFIVSILLQLTQTGTFVSVLYVIIVFVVVQLIEGYLLTPKLVGKKIGVHPVIIILSLLLGGVFFGFIGVMFALPMAAVIVAILRELKRPKN